MKLCSRILVCLACCVASRAIGAPAVRQLNNLVRALPVSHLAQGRVLEARSGRAHV